MTTNYGCASREGKSQQESKDVAATDHEATCLQNASCNEACAMWRRRHSG